jgi:hypothetical protein
MSADNTAPMAAPAAETVSPVEAPSGPPAPERLIYGASFARTFVFSMVFLLLLPFFASMPMMIGMRASNGLLADNWGLVVLALVFAALMFLILVELIFSIRTRVDLGPEKVRMTLPSGRGPTPMLRYRSHEFGYDQVQSVETRREIYGGAVVPMLLKGARVNLKDGQVISLGYLSEANTDSAFPYPEIAGRIAERARLPLIDRGSVRRSVRSKFLGLKAAGTADDTVSEQEIESLNSRHNVFMMFLIGVFLVLIALGLVEDFSSGTPIGQTAALERAAPDVS